MADGLPTTIPIGLPTVPASTPVPVGAVFPDTREWTTLMRWTTYQVGDDMTRRRRGRSNAAAQKQVGGHGTLIQVHYGLRTVGARIGCLIVHQGRLLMLCVWGEGEIDAVEQVFVNNEAMPAAIEATHYYGTEAQAADPWLVAAFAAIGQTYADTLPRIAYSVLRVPSRANVGFPEVSARIRGRKVATTEGGTPTYSTCPAYIIADFIESTRYGLGASVNWSDVAALAARNNETVSSETRHVLSVSIDSPATVEEWLKTLCDYASAIPVKDGSTYRLFLDAPGSSVGTIAKADVVEHSLQWDQRAPHDVPTVIEVVYTDTSLIPWRDASVFVYAPGADTGAIPRRLSRVSRPGIQRHSEAYRYGLQLLNGFTTSDLTVRFQAFDQGIKYLPGDIVTVNVTPFSSKLVRIVSMMPATPQLWNVTAVEYDAAKWSDTAVSGPTTLDTSLPTPLDVPTPTGLSVTESIEQIQTGRFVSRLVIDATGPTHDDYIYLEGFTLRYSDGTNETSVEIPATGLPYTTPALPENLLYTVGLRARSQLAAGDEAIATITNNGKQALPSDVPAISVYSVNGEARISWTLPTDLDLTSTELRYSDQSTVDWDDAALLVFVPAPQAQYTTTLLPPGPWRIWAKGHDSVATDEYPNGQESVNALYTDVTVAASNTSSSDETALVIGATTNMLAMITGGWITSISGDTWNSTFTAAMSTYTNPIASYHTSATSGLVTDWVDYTASEGGTFQATLDFDDLAGSGQVYIEYKVLVGDTPTRVNAALTTATGRYFRVGVEWTGTEAGQVNSLGVLRKTTDATENFVQHTGIGDAAVWVM